MAAFIIVDVEVSDPEVYDTYRQQVPPTLEPYAGSFVVRGGPTEVIEGEWSPKRLVVISFPSATQARQWYRSEAYQAILGIRTRSSRANMVLVEGV